MISRKIRAILSALAVALLVACTSPAAEPVEQSLSVDDLDAPAMPDEKASLVREAESTLAAADEDVVDYAIADYKSFDPSGIIVHFEFDNATLGDDAIAALNKIVAGMKKDPLARISVRGHADKQGTHEYNHSLSGRRAKAIEDFLVQHGIEKDRMNPLSMGDSDPIEEGETITVFKKNRRGDFTINYGPSAFGKAP